MCRLAAKANRSTHCTKKQNRKGAWLAKQGAKGIRSGRRDPARLKVEPVEKILPAKTYMLSVEDTKNYPKYEKLWNEIFQLR